MRLLKMLGVAVALQLVAAPAMAQATSDKNENAHHYQGGPKTATIGAATTGRSTGGHHYRGGPKSSFHHMGDNP